MARAVMSTTDSVFLALEDPTNLMMITGGMVLGAPLGRARLRATIERWLLPFDRFRHGAVASHWRRGTSYWEDDPGFDHDHHLQRLVLPASVDQATLQEVVSRLASTPLDLSRPLWQFHLVETFGEGSALICRLHHAMADGMGLVNVLLSLADTEPDAPPPTAVPDEVPPPSVQQQDRLLGPVSRRLRTRRRRVRSLLRKGLGVAVHPSRLSSAVQRAKASPRRWPSWHWRNPIPKARSRAS